MRLGEVFRFELALQARRPSAWLYFAALAGISFYMLREMNVAAARSGGFFFNPPSALAEATVLGGTMALLAFAAVAGDAGARDVQTRMHPLFYTTPVGRLTYLAGRFLAALALNALILLAIPAGLLLAALAPGVEPELVAPFRAGAYLRPYLFLGLPNALFATALLFAVAALGRRAAASYLGAVLLFFWSLFDLLFVAAHLGRWELAKLLDPLGITVLGELLRSWTPEQRNTLPLLLEGSLLVNRLVWIGAALAVLALVALRFRFAHPAAGGGRAGRAEEAAARPAAVAVPPARRRFGAGARARQVLAVAAESFRVVVASWGGAALALLTVLLVIAGPSWMEHLGVPLFPTTERFTRFIGQSGEILWMIVPLLAVYYAGELVWRERDAGLAEIADAAPVPEWVPLAGKLLGLALVFAALEALMAAAAMLVQARLGYYDFEVGVYARILFGFQLADYLLFAVLAVVVHVVVDHRYAAHMALVAAYLFTTFAPEMGLAHNLLVFGSDPGWSYSDMRGFGPFVAPFVWFKLYWAAWALLLGLAAKLLWVRGTEAGRGVRLRNARRRVSRPAAAALAGALGLVVVLGGFVFYNTDVLNERSTEAERLERAAEYERRYGRFARAPQPTLAGTGLHVEIHPRGRRVEIRGRYLLVNRSGVPIDSIHLATEPEVATTGVRFDRRAVRVLADEELGHRIYVLDSPLAPGDSLRLHFAVRFAPRGFPERGVDASVAANGTFFRNHDWLPSVGYQPGREARGVGDRRALGLAPRPRVRSLFDVAAREDLAGAERVALEVVVGTDGDQVAVAPGRLLRSWAEGERRYFHYATDVPIRNDFAVFSADYAVERGRWRDVEIEVFHHPGHPWNAERMVEGARASLEFLTERFGPYPHGQVRLVEHPGRSASLHAFPVNVSFQEGFAVFRPERDPRGIDFPFAVVAHEMAHHWWGNMLMPADVEGAPLLTESLAWFSAMGVVEDAFGREHLDRLLDMMRGAFLAPSARAAPPLLRSTDRFAAYRKGPFAMFALREYVGEERVNGALRRLLERHGSGAPPLPTSLDLLRELRAVTPDSLGYLLTDLFEANTFWELEARRASAVRAGDGEWRVTLVVDARKVVVDTADVEMVVPMDDLVEVGVFAAAEDGGPGEPLYLRMHRVRSGEQRITVTVPREPGSAGVDPRNLLIDLVPGDNVVEVGRGGA